MSRRPAADVAVPCTIDNIQFRLATSTLTHLPDAAGFIRAQLAKGVSTPVAGEYARLVARAIRIGYASDPARITSRPERTAVNAYWAWVETAYYERVGPVVRAFAMHDVRKSLPWLRVGSVVPPSPDKQIPRLLKVAQVQLDEATMGATMSEPEYGWVPSSAWTLHVPKAACPAHKDPCLTCTAVELTAAQLEVIAAAFEKAWGHRDLFRVPPECPLFGTPPREGGPADRKVETAGSVVALLPESALADTLRQIRAHVTAAPESFIDRLSRGADVIVISRAAAGARYDDVLAAVRAAWSEAAPVDTEPHTAV